MCLIAKQMAMRHFFIVVLYKFSQNRYTGSRMQFPYRPIIYKEGICTKCQQCGDTLPEGTRFCPKCGAVQFCADGSLPPPDEKISSDILADSYPMKWYKLVADLKKIYTAVTLQEAEENLSSFSEEWRKQYPSCVKSREDNWEVLSTFFEYPPEIRKIKR